MGMTDFAVVRFGFNHLSTHKDLEELKVSPLSRLSRVCVADDFRHSSRTKVNTALVLNVSMALLTWTDTRKFTLAVSQTCEAIEAAANWLDRDQKDVEQVRSLSSEISPSFKLTNLVVEGEQVPVVGRRKEDSMKVFYEICNLGASENHLRIHYLTISTTVLTIHHRAPLCTGPCPCARPSR